jgi:hypothetical protein
MIGLAIVSLLFGVAATAAGILAVDRMHVVLTLTPVSDLMLPVGHWSLVLAWMAIVAALVPTERHSALARCFGVGLALHAIVLVTLFVDKLGDREAFSATVYLLYARLFCMAALSIATCWVLASLQRMRSGTEAIAVLALPMTIGAVALAAALVRQNIVMAASALAAGIAAFAAMTVAPAATSRWRSTVTSLATNPTVFLAAVFVAGFALRLLYVQRIMGDPGYLDTGADGRVYDELAWSIASGGGIPESFTNRYPMLLLGYVWFLAAVYKLAGHSYFIAVALQSMLGAATAVLVYFAGKRAFGVAPARVAAVFTALSFSLIFTAAALGHQAVDVFLTVLIALILLRLVSTGGIAWQWAAAGVVMGGAVAVRETAIFFAAFVAGWIVLRHPRGRLASGQALAAYLAGAAIVLLPFVAPKIWSAEARRHVFAHFDRLYRGEAEPQPTRGSLVGPLADPQAALSQLTSSPVLVAGTLARAYARNFAAQFLAQPYGGFDLVFLRKGTEYYYGMWFYAYAFAVAGTVAAIRGISRGGAAAAGAILVLGLIASRTLPHIILESDYRHRAPIEPFLILLSSVGAVAAWRAVSATPARTITSGLTGSD